MGAGHAVTHRILNVYLSPYNCLPTPYHQYPFTPIYPYFHRPVLAGGTTPEAPTVALTGGTAHLPNHVAAHVIYVPPALGVFGCNLHTVIDSKKYFGSHPVCRTHEFHIGGCP